MGGLSIRSKTHKPRNALSSVVGVHRNVVGYGDRMLAMLLGEKCWIGIFGEDGVGGGRCLTRRRGGALSLSLPLVLGTVPHPSDRHPAGTVVEGWLACWVSIEVAADTRVRSTLREGWGTNVSRWGTNDRLFRSSVET